MACCGFVPKDGKKPVVIIAIIVLVLGILLFPSFILNIITGGIFDAIAKERFTVGSLADAVAAEGLSTSASKPESTFYLYSLTNEAAVVAGAEPEFESIGPYVYSTTVGKADTAYNAATDTFTYKGRFVQEFVPARSEDPDKVITTIDAVYAGMFGAAQPGVTESTLLYSVALTNVFVIESYIASVLATVKYTAEMAVYSGDDTAFWTEKYANVSDNYGETIDSFQDLLYAHWGGGAMELDGVDMQNNSAGSNDTVATSATARGYIASTLLTASSLSDAGKATITAAFSSDSQFATLGLYQVMRITGSDCDRLTVAEVTSIMACYYSATCGLVAVATILADTGDNTLNTAGFSQFGLSYSNTKHQCYRTAITSYAHYMLPLANHFFRDRLYAEKGGVTDNIIEKKTAKQMLEGYTSPTMVALGQPVTFVAGPTLNHTTAASATAAGQTFVVGAGHKVTAKLNHLYSYKGVDGYDYNGDGTVTLFTDSPTGCFDGSNFFPPNQKKMSWEPLQTQYEVFDSSLYKACSFKYTGSKYSLGPFETPLFVRDDAQCYVTDVARATTNGYQSVRHIMGADVYMTPPCMYEYTSEKLWIDDCGTPTGVEHGTYTAIDSVAGIPWMLQKNGQLVVGFDVSTNAFDMSSIDTTKRFPAFRVKTRMELSEQDKKELLGTYEPLFLMKDVLAWVGLGIGLLFIIVGVVLLKFGCRKVDQTVPVNNSVEVKQAA